MSNIKSFLFGFGMVFSSLFSLILISPPSRVLAVNPWPRTDYDTQITKKVLMVVFNPYLEAYGTSLIPYKGWASPTNLANQYVNELKSLSGNYINYQIIETRWRDDIPVKLDGFHYTDQQYLNCLSNTATCHKPDDVNMTTIVNNESFCNMVNANQADELWIWNAPYFGVDEAAMTGPGAYNTNGDIILGTNCNRPVHVMGFSYEFLSNQPDRTFHNMLHNFVHRTETSINKAFNAETVYGLSLIYPNLYRSHAYLAFQGKNPDQARCGYMHATPNNVVENDNYNKQNYVKSQCQDYYAYPYLQYPQIGGYQMVNCSAWGCTELGFARYWLEHLPKYKGRTEGSWDNWWKYSIDFASANIAPSTAEPKGSLDGQSGDCTIVGWSCDWSSYNQPLTVEFYEGPVKKGETVASAWREDGVANLCGGNRYHGFTYKMPASSQMYDGQTHYVYARAKDINGSNQQTGLLWTLTNSPRAITCSMNP